MQPEAVLIGKCSWQVEFTKFVAMRESPVFGSFDESRSRNVNLQRLGKYLTGGSLSALCTLKFCRATTWGSVEIDLVVKA